jgi:hypothetical protein
MRNNMDTTSLFPGFETTTFPVESCTDPDVREDGIKNSTEKYVCVIADSRWPARLEVMIMTPYTYTDPCPVVGESSTSYAWMSVDSDMFVDHVDSPVHGDHRRVIAWKPCASGSFTFQKW